MNHKFHIFERQKITFYDVECTLSKIIQKNCFLASNAVHGTLDCQRMYMFMILISVEFVAT